jgi:DNA-binding transcriptional regulator PaaX
MSIVGEILQELWNTSLYYKGARVNIFGIPRFKKYPHETLRRTINRLSRGKIIEKKLDGIILTSQGKKYVADSFIYFERPEKQGAKKDLLLLFDIPNTETVKRDWLRFHLKKFGFIMVQRSVWVGPSPLPKEFRAYLKKIQIEKCIKTFTLKGGYKK